MYLTVAEYLDRVEQHQRDTFAKVPRWQPACDAPLLVIDDLGAASERNLPSIRERIAELFFRRHKEKDRNNLWTVTCSVLEPAQIEARYGPEVLSRLGTQYGEFARRDETGGYIWRDRRLGA
jgi:DNA replication protein DnaC